MQDFLHPYGGSQKKRAFGKAPSFGGEFGAYGVQGFGPVPHSMMIHPASSEL